MDKIAMYEALLEDHPLWEKEAADPAERARSGADLQAAGEIGTFLSPTIRAATRSPTVGMGAGLAGLAARIGGAYQVRNAARDAGIGRDYEGRGSFARRSPLLSSLIPVAGTLSADRLAEEVARRQGE